MTGTTNGHGITTHKFAVRLPMLRGSASEFGFLSAPGAHLLVRYVPDTSAGAEIQFFGNRAGLLSLANILLWLVANPWQREFLSFAELPFVRLDGTLSVRIRVALEDPTGRDGQVSQTDGAEQYEWLITEDDLQRVALTVHRLVCVPEHEYDRLWMTDASAVGVHIRMTDAAGWCPMHMSES